MSRASRVKSWFFSCQPSVAAETLLGTSARDWTDNLRRPVQQGHHPQQKLIPNVQSLCGFTRASCCSLKRHGSSSGARASCQKTKVRSPVTLPLMTPSGFQSCMATRPVFRRRASVARAPVCRTAFHDHPLLRLPRCADGKGLRGESSTFRPDAHARRKAVRPFGQIQTVAQNHAVLILLARP